MTYFFFKQKTAYEMRISDWSSDVCSSDLDRTWGYSRRERSRPNMTTSEIFLIALLIIFAVPWLFWRLLRTDYWAPLVVVQIVGGILQIGRASCRDRVCQYV